MRRLVALVAATQLCACSFVFVQGPPPDQPKRAIDTQGKDELVCTDSRVVPVLDAVFTALMAVNLAYSIGSDDPQVFRKSVGIPLYGVAALAGAAGMYVGFPRVAKCKAAHEVLIKEGIEKPELPKPGQLVVPTAPL